ncbi:hypothetical protein PM082_003989 [Marasmius tenuissimus]|nr:hypothetical protein PM082_003989 [Marasmius tenuissimus]
MDSVFGFAFSLLYTSPFRTTSRCASSTTTKNSRHPHTHPPTSYSTFPFSLSLDTVMPAILSLSLASTTCTLMRALTIPGEATHRLATSLHDHIYGLPEVFLLARHRQQFTNPQTCI